MEEIWKIVPGFERYLISSFGRAKSIDWIRPDGSKCKGIILKGTKTKKGYLSIKLYGNKKRRTVNIHRLLAEVFLLNPLGLPEVDHKNGIKTDNILDNLEWVTNKENMRRAAKLGLIKGKFREKNGWYKGRILVYDKSGSLIDIISGTKEMEEKGYSHKHVYGCISGKRKTHQGKIFKREIL